MTLAFIPIGPWEIAIIAIVGVLIFGRRLPEVGRNMGRGIVEFKRGLSGLDDTPAESKPKLPEQEQPPVQPRDKSAQEAESSSDSR